MVGTGVGASLGVLIKGGDALELASKVDCVVFDKTGTLTEGCPVVSNHWVIPGVDLEEVVSLAAALEMESNHPLANAVLSFASEILLLSDAPLRDASQTRQVVQQSINAVADTAETCNGMGVTGKVSPFLHHT
jgi:Cu+-exporting ATPase